MKLSKKLLLTAAMATSIFSTVNADVKLFGYSNLVHTWETGKHAAFDQVNTNLMMQHEVDRFRFFAEIEFQHSPSFQGEGTTTTTTGTGAINLERAYTEIFLNKYATVRMGRMLNTTLYVDNHYPSIVTPIDSPMLSKNIFGEFMEGAQLRGEIFGGFSYIAWLDHKTVEKTEGLQHVGGNLQYEGTIGPVWLKAGLLIGSYEKQDPTSATYKLYKQTAQGAELQLKIGNFTFWSEYAQMNDDKTLADNARGFYELFSYSIDTSAGEFIPFLLLDSYRGNSGGVNGASTELVKNIFSKSIGLTYRPIPVISLKAEYTMVNEIVYKNATLPKTNKAQLAFVYFYN